MRPGRARRISAGKPGLLTQTLTLTLTPGSGSVRSEIRDIGRDFTCSNAVTGFSQKGKNIMAGPVVNTLLTLPQKVFSFRRISLSHQETIRPRKQASKRVYVIVLFRPFSKISPIRASFGM
jgi:hypothetical protein